MSQCCAIAQISKERYGQKFEIVLTKEFVILYTCPHSAQRINLSCSGSRLFRQTKYTLQYLQWYIHVCLFHGKAWSHSYCSVPDRVTINVFEKQKRAVISVNASDAGWCTWIVPVQIIKTLGRKQLFLKQ